MLYSPDRGQASASTSIRSDSSLEEVVCQCWHEIEVRNEGAKRLHTVSVGSACAHICVQRNCAYGNAEIRPCSYTNCDDFILSYRSACWGLLYSPFGCATLDRALTLALREGWKGVKIRIAFIKVWFKSTVLNSRTVYSVVVFSNKCETSNSKVVSTGRT